jgi:hypothetical protein
MAHNSRPTASADDSLSDLTAAPDVQVDDLERLTELAKNASPETRARLENTIAVVAQSRRIRAMTIKTIQMELHSMDEETRSLAELHILKDRGGK